MKKKIIGVLILGGIISLMFVSPLIVEAIRDQHILFLFLVGWLGMSIITGGAILGTHLLTED